MNILTIFHRFSVALLDSTGRPFLGLCPSSVFIFASGPLVVGSWAGVLAATDSSDLGRGLLSLPSRSAQESAWAELLDFLPTLVGWRQHLLRARARACPSLRSELVDPHSHYPGECASRFSGFQNRKNPDFCHQTLASSCQKARGKTRIYTQDFSNVDLPISKQSE